MRKIPDGWVLLSSYDDREDKRKGGPTGDYRILLAATNAGRISTQAIPGISGRLVMKEEADGFLLRRRARAVSHRRGDEGPEVSVEALEVLRGIAESLQRIASALDSIGGSEWFSTPASRPAAPTPEVLM